MARVTILGAGDMGTALVTPLCHNLHEVRLWGTERDHAIVAALREGRAHSRLGVALPSDVSVYPAREAAVALARAEIVVVAITSDAVRTVLSGLREHLGDPAAVVTVAKGFDREPGGAIQLLPETIAEITPAPVVAVGGPSKANEVALGQPTAIVFGGTDSDALTRCAGVFATPSYRVEKTPDVVGLEIAAAMKNAYAIALGITDGLERRTATPYHNLRAALFPRAVAEIATLVEVSGGHKETAFGLAGMGDLQVTITSGRNRLLGERIGAGETPLGAVCNLTASGTTVEGYLAADFGYRLYREAVTSKALPEGRLPLLDVLWRILFAGAAVPAALWDAAT